MSGIVQRQCVVRSCEETAEQTFLLTFDSREIAARALPGQFVNVQVDGTTGSCLLRRPFSISRIHGDIVELLFNVVGPGTLILSRKKRGDEINVLGPLGHPFHLDSDYDTALLVGGGLGVAPFPFLTTALLARGKRVRTFVGFRSKRQKCIAHMRNVRVATDDGSEGFPGTVVQLLEKFFCDRGGEKAKIFACGPTKMLKALTELAQQYSICCELSLEGQMACGIGICQGCPVERADGRPGYALVCKDGPTFMATDVKL
jgi:dihydroorotate dehydrogenase electron transfer subunit